LKPDVPAIAPALGQHTREIAEELGIRGAALSALIEQGALSLAATAKS
jgi:crotonobetainyl-CoA:carnitine CoA-transferase CaiB-like acyl-CoA transferase